MLDNPYVGPRPFELGEKLYGRGREERELFHKLKARRVVLLHSPSGAGKSSLVQASLRQRLTEDRFDVWPTVRLNLEPSFPGNRFVASTIASLEDGVLKEERRSLDKVTGLRLTEYVEGRPRGEAPESVVLVFDQFEEVLTVDPVDARAKREFFRQLGEALRDPRVWALFAIREDYLAALAPYRDLVPTKLSNTYRIDLLVRDAAREAIVETARDGGRAFPAAEQLLDDLATMQLQQPDGSFAAEKGHYVEPVQLQVTCRHFWDAMPEDDLSIDAEDLKEFGNVGRALAHYYRDCAQRIAGGDVRRERTIREWFGERLIAAVGVRAQVLREAGASGGLDNVLVEKLLATHLVRAEKRAGATWYELAHDRLLGPVWEDNGVWREEHLSEVQKQASLWEREGRPPGLLFLKQKLAAAERWTTENEGLVTVVERKFLAASRTANKAADRERQLFQVTIFIALIAIMAGVFAVLQWRVAARSAREAATSQAKARKNEIKAIENAREAAANEARAKKSETKAVESAREAAASQAKAKKSETKAIRSAREAAASQAKAKELARAATANSLLANGKGTLGNLAALEVREPDEVPTAVATLHEALGTRLDAIVLRGHKGDVVEASFSPDGRRVFTASEDNSARIWNAETGEEILTLEGHYNNVAHAAWSDDGRRVLTVAAWDYTARIWNAETGAVIHILEGHSGRVVQATWNGNERRVLTASRDNTARIWNAETGEETLTLEGHSDDVLHAAWSGDEQRVLTASRDNTARIWNAETGEAGLTLEGHSDIIVHVSWSSDGSRVLTASADGTARIWNSDNGEAIHTLEGHSHYIFHATWSGDEQRVLTASRDNTARIWNAETAEQIHALKGHSGDVVHAAWSSDGRQVLTASRDNTARIWNAETAEQILTLEGHSSSVAHAAWSGDGRRVLTASRDHTARIWSVEVGERIHTLKGHSGDVLHAAWSSDGQRILTASTDDTARIWNAETAEQIHALKGHSDTIVHAAWSADGRRILTASTDDTAHIWNAETGEEIHTLKGHSNWVIHTAWSGDGRRALTASWDNTARIWNAETGEEIHTLEGHSHYIFHATWNGDERRVLTASDDGTARIWNAETGEEIHTLEGHSINVVHAAWSDDGRRAITTSEDLTARIWNTETGEEIHTLKGHSLSVVHAAWSGDGRRVLTASWDDTARIWNAETGEELRTLTHSNDVLHAAWSADGRRVLTASRDNTARIWNAETGEEIHSFEGHSNWAFSNHAAWSGDGRRVLTASSATNTASIWATGTEHLQARIRARTRLCLPSDVRQRSLGETFAEAERHVAACEACVPGFFERLEGIPQGAVEPYVEAWRAYRACLDQSSDRVGG